MAHRKGKGKIISDCETGNPPEGWESEGQLRISDLKARKQESGEAQSKSIGKKVGGSRTTGRWERRRRGKEETRRDGETGTRKIDDGG